MWEWKQGVLGSGDSTTQSWCGEAQNLLASDIFMNIYIYFLSLSFSLSLSSMLLCVRALPLVICGLWWTICPSACPSLPVTTAARSSSSISPNAM